MPDTLPNAPRKMIRLNKAGWIIKALATLFVVAFLCAYLNISIRYGTPHTQTRASLNHSLTQQPLPIRTHFSPRRRAFHHHQPVFLRVRHITRRQPRTRLYHLASLRHLRHLFTEMLDVRS